MRLLIALLLLAFPAAALAQGSPTYYGSAINVAVQAAATDVICLEGSAGKVSKLAGFSISGTAANPSTLTISILRRSTLSSGGTSALIAAAIGSPTHASATSIMRVWSANPATLGTADGVFRRIRWDVDSKVSVPTTIGLIAQMAANPYTTQPEVRSATQAICMNFNGLGPVTTMDISMVWTETNQ